jgi:hypothetical protein
MFRPALPKFFEAAFYSGHVVGVELFVVPHAGEHADCDESRRGGPVPQNFNRSVLT